MSTNYQQVPGGQTHGSVAPADGNYKVNGGDESASIDLGANNERLEELKPKLVHALRELVRQYREEGIVARRHEIRRIRQARLFWQGLQYAWWNPNDMNWHLPFEQRSSDDRALEEMPRYQFVTNFYQGFGLSFIAVLSQDVPSVRFYPQSAQSLEDISAARAASDVAALIEQNNHIEHLLTSIGYFLWTDGKLGAYVRAKLAVGPQEISDRGEQMLDVIILLDQGGDIAGCARRGNILERLRRLGVEAHARDILRKHRDKRQPKTLIKIGDELIARHLFERAIVARAMLERQMPVHVVRIPPGVLQALPEKTRLANPSNLMATRDDALLAILPHQLTQSMHQLRLQLL